MKISHILNVLFSLLTLSIMACSEQSSEPLVMQESDKAALQIRDSSTSAINKTIALDVYKSPTCGCCGKWVEHAQQRGFSLTTHHPKDLNKLKVEQGIAPQYQSCHTVVSEQGYIFEGHIPARYIHDFLAAPPADARGLAVPAMPMGSPGMEMGDRFTSYQVLLLKSDGSAEVFAEVNTAAQQYQ